jgi:hypothetical protein
MGLRVFQRYVDRDRTKRLHNAARLQQLHAAHASEVSVICSHDPKQLNRCQQRTPPRDGVRPAEIELEG